MKAACEVRKAKLPLIATFTKIYDFSHQATFSEYYFLFLPVNSINNAPL
jgi:hypothetical protein